MKELNIRVDIDISSLEFNVEAINQAVSEELETTIYKCQRTARELVPKDTSTLANSIDVEGGGLEWSTGTNLEYAGYIEDGTSPHEIWGNPMLRLHDGRYAYRVYHPGNKAYEYMWNAFQTHVVGIEERILLAVMKVL